MTLNRQLRRRIGDDLPQSIRTAQRVDYRSVPGGPARRRRKRPVVFEYGKKCCCHRRGGYSAHHHLVELDENVRGRIVEQPGKTVKRARRRPRHRVVDLRFKADRAVGGRQRIERCDVQSHVLLDGRRHHFLCALMQAYEPTLQSGA